MKRFFVIFMFCIGPAYADVYKCAGDNGAVKFSDSPCNDAAKKIDATNVKSESKKAKLYPGYNQEKYLSLSVSKRNEICSLKKKSYENKVSSECLTTLYGETGERGCLSGQQLDAAIKLAKSDYEFACQI